MSKINVPSVGSIITVTTYHASNVIGRTVEDDTTVYENVTVLPPQAWTPSGSFCIPAVNEPFIKFRTIAINQVTDLVIHEGGAADREHGTIIVPVAGSNDNIYSVVVTDGVATSCDCKGFQYRGNCRHGRIATGETPVNPRRKRNKKKTVRKSVARKRKAATKADLVRDIIRKRKGAMTEESLDIIAQVKEQCITDVIEKVGFKRGLAKSYVVNNWEKVQ